MLLQIDKLGKVAVTIEKDYWNINKDYDKLTVVEVADKFATYISRIPVPAGTELNNRKYWIPFSSLKEEIVIHYNEWINLFGGLLTSQAEVLNNIQKIINDIYTHLPKGIIFEGDIDVYDVGESAIIHLTCTTTGTKPASEIKLYKNNTLIETWHNVTGFEIDETVDNDTEFRVEAVIDGWKYYGSWNVAMVYPFYIGTGTDVEDIIANEDYKHKGSEGLNGIYQVSPNDSDNIFIVAPKWVAIPEATMGGIKIPFDNATEYIIDEIVYYVYKSSNQYQQGHYSIKIGSVEYDKDSLTAELLNKVTDMSDEFANYDDRISEVERISGNREKSSVAPTHMGRVTLKPNVKYPITKGWGIYSYTFDYEGDYTVDVLIYFENDKFYLPYRNVRHPKVINVISQTSYGEQKLDVGDADVNDIATALNITEESQYLFYDDDDFVVTMPDDSKLLIPDVIRNNWPLHDYTDFLDVKNLLTQSMINEPNTIYVIQYDFTLDGKEITIPEGCVLKFEGGSLSGGTLVLDYTYIQGTKGINCTLTGTIGNSEVNVNILKDELDSTLVNTLFAVKPAKVIFNAIEYPLKNIEICANVEIEGNDSKIIPQKKEQDIFENFNLLYNVFNANNIDNVSISGFYFESDLHNSTPDVSQKQSVYSDPLINIVNAKNVTIANCVFKNIEGCTYINPNYTHYGKKQGLLICVWDADKTIIENIETTQCRYDEQIWIIACDKDRKDIEVVFRNNYIHDQDPQMNSSALTCVCNNVLLENNKVDNFAYTGSIFNLFGLVVTAINNVIINSRATSVFDTSEFGYFFCDKVTVSNNFVNCENAILLVTVAEHIIMDNNTWYGHTFLYSDNHHAGVPGGEYPHMYRVPRKSNISTIIKNNIIDCRNYNKEYPVAGSGDMLHKIYIKPLEYYGDFINIENNSVWDIVEYDNDDQNVYSGGVKQTFTTINIVNIKDSIIKGNIFYSAPKVIQSSVWKSNISIKLSTAYEEEELHELPFIDIFDNSCFTSNDEYTFCDVRSLMSSPILISKVTMNNNKILGLNRVYYNLKTPYIVNAVIKEFFSNDVVSVVTPLIVYIKATIYNKNRNLIGAYTKENYNGVTLEYSDFTAIQEIVYNNVATSVSVGQQIRMGNSRVYKVVKAGIINPEDVPESLSTDDFVTIGNVVLYPLAVERPPKTSNCLIETARPSFGNSQKGVSMYDKTANVPIWFNGSRWTTSEGISAENVTAASGSTTIMNELATHLSFLNNGFRFFNTDLNKWCIWHYVNSNRKRFEDERGYYPGVHMGTTEIRTGLTANLDTYDQGYDFYDVTANKIYYFGFNNGTKVWRDAAGNIEH